MQKYDYNDRNSGGMTSATIITRTYIPKQPYQQKMSRHELEHDQYNCQHAAMGYRDDLFDE